MATATTIAAVGVGVSAAGAGASFIQAAKQQNLQRKAEAAAEQAMAEARKKLEVNFYDQLSINKEPYELQREALLSQGAQAIQAAQEGERNVAATAGRVAMAQNEAQGQIRTAMGKEMQDLERMRAIEESRLRDVNVQIDMERAKGAQLAARDAQSAANRATSAGIAGIQNTAQMAISSLVPLYADKSTSASAKTSSGIPNQPSRLQVKQYTQAPDSTYQMQGTTASVNPGQQEILGLNNPYAISTLAKPQMINYTPSTTGTYYPPDMGFNNQNYDPILNPYNYNPYIPYNPQ